jgi:hypothetical protein
MTGPRARTARVYPHTVALRDGTTVSLRLMTAADAGRIAAFARSLPEDDLLFLRTDITDPSAVALWVKNLEAGLATTVIAEASGEPARSSPSAGSGACGRSWPR